MPLPMSRPTSVLLPMVVDAQVEEGKEVVIVQQHFVGRLLERHIHI